MNAFLAIWAGQLVSVLGSGLTTFGLAVWMFQRTGDVGDLALIAAAIYLPHVMLAPYAGVLADRYDRRRLMLVADVGAALVTATILAMAWDAALGPWTATALVALSASCNALQMPAYEAAVVALVPKQRLGQANGLCELSRGTTQLLAPVVAGALFGVIGLKGLIAIDLGSFVLGVAPLLVVRIPRHARAPQRQGGRATWLADLAVAWRFISRRPGLVAMLALFAATNFTFAVVELLLKPLVLSFGSPLKLGLVLSSVGIGMVLGSIGMASWGGPRRRVAGILAFQLVEGAALVVGGARPSVALMCCGAFAYGAVIPLTFGCARYLWQVKVPHALQGRVTALRNSIVMLAIPLGYAAATPLAELCEPWLMPGGALAASVGAVIDVGVGRGTALVVIVMGVATWATALAAFAFAPYRRIETELEDLLESQGDACGRRSDDTPASRTNAATRAEHTEC